MRTILFVTAVGLTTLGGGPPVAAQPRSDDVDLLGRNLKDWTRMGSGKNAWRLTADRTLVCGPANDAYAPDSAFGDGTLRFEYRFRPTGQKTGYKAFLCVRRNGSTNGARIALGDDCGTITGTFLASLEPTKDVEVKPIGKHGRDPGEWNDIAVRMEGKTVTVAINGKEAGTWERCPEKRGIVVFEVEGSETEFRRIQWKEGN